MSEIIDKINNTIKEQRDAQAKYNIDEHLRLIENLEAQIQEQVNMMQSKKAMHDSLEANITKLENAKRVIEKLEV